MTVCPVQVGTPELRKKSESLLKFNYHSSSSGGFPDRSCRIQNKSTCFAGNWGIHSAVAAAAAGLAGLADLERTAKKADQ